jgi:methyl-accepting chemotaxis protein
MIEAGMKISQTNTSMVASSASQMYVVISIIIILSILLGLIIAANIQNIIKSVIKQTKDLVEAAIAGKLSSRAKPEDTNEEFREITVGINKTLDAVIGPLNVAAEYVDRISKGNIPPKITDTYNGDFNEIKNNLNVCIDSLNGLTNEMSGTTNIQMKGEIDTFANENKFEGSYKTIIKGYNDGMKIHINVILEAIGLLNEYAKGDLSKEMRKLPGKQIVMTEAMNVLRQNVLLLIGDANMLAKAAVDGKLATRADASKHLGDFRKIVDGVNTTLDAVIGPLNVAANYIDNIAKGDNPPKITDKYNGDFNVIKNNINTLIDVLNDITAKVQVFAVGDLSIKFTERSQNDHLLKSLNDLIRIEKEVVEKTKQLSKGNLTIEIQRRSEKDELLIALSTMVEKLKEIVTQVTEATENVATGSQQLSSSATEMSQGANEQAASTEEVSSSIEEMTSTIQQNTDNAVQTEKIARESADGIIKVNKSSEDSVKAIREISDKITIINDIAEKTDILAINAAIEAARAGEHGKGFAVVAAEVRKLAEVSQRAAKEINELSHQSLRVTEESSKLLTEMIPNIQKTTQLVQEISAASTEQNANAGQINKAIEQLNQVTQQNSAAAEEMSSSSEELSSQAELLKDVISFFNIGKKTATTKHLRKSHILSNSKVYQEKGIKISMGVNGDGDDDSEFQKY